MLSSNAAVAIAETSPPLSLIITFSSTSLKRRRELSKRVLSSVEVEQRHHFLFALQSLLFPQALNGAKNKGWFEAIIGLRGTVIEQRYRYFFTLQSPTQAWNVEKKQTNPLMAYDELYPLPCSMCSLSKVVVQNDWCPVKRRTEFPFVCTGD